MEVHSSHLQPDNVAKKTQRTSVRSQSSLSYPSQTIVKAKLEMTKPGDYDEIEADNAANEIINGGKISRKISEGSSSSGVRVSTAMESQLSHMQGGGHSMPSGLQSMMENGFGRDFSQVRLHTDSQAAEMSSSINAKAFTLGNDIYFNKGQFSPNTTEGQRLVAHELTHVAQGNGKVGRDVLTPFLTLHAWNGNEKEATSDWLNGTVLNQKTKTQLLVDLFPNKERTPINIILYTTRKAACSGKDYNQDPSCSEPFEGEEINNFVKNTQGRNSNSNVKLKTFVLYGNEHLGDYLNEMRKLVKIYGPLQNLIISGHGNFNGPNIGTIESLSLGKEGEGNSFFTEVGNLMFINKDDKSIHSIVFDECLVGVELGRKNYADEVYRIVHKKVPRLNVFANYAATNASHNTDSGITNSEISYDNNGNITYTNHSDPTAVCESNGTSSCSSTSVRYKGDDTNGYLGEIWRQCNNLNNVVITDGLFPNCDDQCIMVFEFGNVKYYFTLNSTPVTQKKFTEFVEGKARIINDSNRSEKERTRTRRKLKELMRILYITYRTWEFTINNLSSHPDDLNSYYNKMSTFTQSHLKK